MPISGKNNLILMASISMEDMSHKAFSWYESKEAKYYYCKPAGPTDLSQACNLTAPALKSYKI